MIGRYLGAAAATAIATLLVAGCTSATEEDLGSAQDALLPADPSPGFGMAASCQKLRQRHQSVRPLDLAQGVIRWGCGDVPGVTDNDLGQEYCEYQAVQNGKIVKTPAQLASDAPVSCVFTAVFTGAGEAPRLKAAMASPENLGTAALEDGIVQMRKGFNGRSAATTLVNDCSRTTSHTKYLRATACWQAFSKGGPNAAQLETLCKSGNLTDATWAQAEALGAKILANGEEGFEEQRDIAGCMNVRGAGSPWRNSDPMICSRVARTTTECGCKFNPVPSQLMGFPLVGWVDDQLPSGCRLAKVDGAAYPYVAICDVTQKELADIPLNPAWNRNIGNFCHDRFAMDFVIKLPLRAIQKPGTCNDTAGFCAEYMNQSADEEPSAPETRESEESSGSRRASR